MSRMMFFTQERYLESLALIGGSRRRGLGGCLGFLISNMEDRVIRDVMDDVFYPKEDTVKVSC